MTIRVHVIDSKTREVAIEKIIYTSTLHTLSTGNTLLYNNHVPSLVNKVTVNNLFEKKYYNILKAAVYSFKEFIDTYANTSKFS